MAGEQLNRPGAGQNSDRWDELSASLAVHRSEFYPVGALRNKHNYKRLLRIERDGSLRESVHLDVPDVAHREQLICWHYLRHLVRYFLQADTGVNILARDCPWDFELQLSTGKEFFLEITSVADNRKHFEINKREERFTKWVGEEFIPVHELRKLADLFPTVELLSIVRDHAKDGRHNSEIVPNPLREARHRVFLSSMLQPDESLTQQFRTAIEKKANKGHAGKDSTVLVIDNRTSAFDLSDYRSAAAEIESILSKMPFPEVWFYTGYCSDHDGTNAEFSFAPLKVTSSQMKVLRTLEVDSKGVHVS